MRPAVWTSYLIELTPEEAVAAFVQAGWPQLELSDEHGRALLDRGDPDRTGMRFAAHVRALGRRRRKHTCGSRWTSPSPNVNPS